MNLFDYGLEWEEPDIWELDYIDCLELDFSDEVCAVWFGDWEYQLFNLHGTHWEESGPWCDQTERLTIFCNSTPLHLEEDIRCGHFFGKDYCGKCPV